MAQPRSFLQHFSLFLFFLCILNLTTAQPRRHLSVRRAHLHQNRHEHERLNEARQIDRDQQGVGTAKLIAQYKSMLTLRDAIADLLSADNAAFLSSDSSRDFTTYRGAEKRQNSNEQLSEKLAQLNSALQGLIELLKMDYNVSGPTSSSGTASSTEATTATATATPTESSTTSSEATSTAPSPAASPSAFDPMSNSNTVVYYSQTDQTSQVPLPELCADPDIDIVILAFITALFSGPNHTGWPSLNLGPHCWAASANQTAAGATGLVDCVSDGFADQISACQAQGKKVMLSIGGAAGHSDTTFASAEKAAEAAGTVWDLFLGGGTRNETAESIRPFGGVVLDGIDIDNESGSTLYISTLMTTLRSLFATDSAHTYFLSAAPQCPRPDASIPLSAMRTQADFVWVQFYNNPSCNLDSAEFIDSLKAWSNDLDSVHDVSVGGVNVTGFQESGNGVTGGPRVFIGAPAFAAAGSGFVEGAQFRGIMEEVKSAELPNLGGVMWWDGAYEEESAGVDGVGESYARIVKELLGGSGKLMD